MDIAWRKKGIQVPSITRAIIRPLNIRTVERALEIFSLAHFQGSRLLRVSFRRKIFLCGGYFPPSNHGVRVHVPGTARVSRYFYTLKQTPQAPPRGHLMFIRSVDNGRLRESLVVSELVVLKRAISGQRG